MYEVLFKEKPVDLVEGAEAKGEPRPGRTPTPLVGLPP
jgi:hypothetical protein